jgi:hypothetical protein
MTRQEFENSLRKLVARRPFQPFIVEYTSGERFEVDGPYVAFSGGAAGFIGPNQSLVHFFDHTTVKGFAPVKKETPSWPRAASPWPCARS